MGYSAQEFWKKVNDRKDKLAVELRESLHQPKDGGSTVYVVSLNNPAKCTTAGRVLTTPLATAALLIEQGTHAVASADQIDALKQEQAQAKAKQVPRGIGIDEIPEKMQFTIQKE